MLICFVVATVATIILGFEDTADEEVTDIVEDEKEKTTPIMEAVVTSPLNGEIVDLKEVNDGVFSEGLLGKGVAIIPNEGKVYAPINGVMTTVFPTKHAYGVTTEDGVEILIHIGINTVELDGELFTKHVKQGEVVQAGDLIAEFDIEKIKEKGYSVYSPIIVTNPSLFESTDVLNSGKIEAGNPILEVK